MVSPLEIDGSAASPPDSLSPSSRRDEQVLAEQRKTSGAMTSISENILTLPFIVIFFVFQSMFQVACKVLGDPLQIMREFFTVNKETDEFLSNAPLEQRQRKRELNNIHEDQVDHRDKLESLRLRIQKLEERRSSREDQSETMVSPGNSKKHA